MTTYIVQTRHMYQSYTDFFNLARLSEYPIVFADELDALDAAGNVYLISPINGEWNHWEAGRFKGKLILYQLEHNVDGQHNTPAAVNEVWCGDKWEAEKNGFRYVPLGGHCGLVESSTPQDKLFDTVMLAYRTPRRQMMEQELALESVTYAPSEGAWNEARSDMLHQSKVMLNIHQWGRVDDAILNRCSVGKEYNQTSYAVSMPVVAPLRWCITAAHGLPMVTESVNDRGVFGYTCMLQADFKYIPQFVSYILKDHYKLDDYAAALQELLCHTYTFRHMIEAHI